MNYLTSLLGGIAWAIIAIVIVVAVLLGISYWFIEPPAGTLMTAVLLTHSHILLAAGIGFALGFWRSLRKQRRGIGSLPG